MSKLSNQIPEVYKLLHQQFGVEWDRGLIIAYGDTIHTRSPEKLPKCLIAHEETHLKQQAEHGGPEVWWISYMQDPKFRIRQEIEAYQNQYKYLLEHENRHSRKAWLKKMAGDLSGPMYGNLCSFEVAAYFITNAS